MATGNRLVANKGKSFQGSNVLGKGFILTPEQADDLIQRDPRNKDVLFPYLNGEDLNSRPDCSASRWVINFHDWSEERARSYPDVFAIVERDVKPERLKNNRKVYRDYWWQYAEKRPAMIKSIKGLDCVLVVALVSRTVMPARVPSQQVLSHKLGVFATAEDGDLTLLSSSFHSIWAWRNSSTMKADLNYSPSDVYETLPWPESIVELTTAGQALENVRRPIMENRQLGLTKLYNLIHDETVTDSGVLELRNLHREIDQEVAGAYGWDDLNLNHGFHPTRQGIRYTVDPVMQIEILDRLLELNHDQRSLELGNITSNVEDRGKLESRNKGSARSSDILTPVDNFLF
ncbi:type IIL restriction-modification enzyme MmeI [Actinacidiphila sp. DG2A-62]|uniref:type IIL restriction-modification enzyme MmeI n=1 Tax=Actinacidiphila sp. DG2A-62 TaxID=3108821 RepID=UPI002DB94269|nr:type IIL restriction-modification enzyme MmeI [Actinacidiphila sp. DG2A-62]MEC3994884.1 type IIL restriction-modification enzyme MmeI [Actinacidiphila sp. DG2A-62]